MKYIVSIFALAISNGLVLSLISPTLASVRYVPSGYPTAQAAINASSGGDVIIIAPGIYTGDGNRDIDFQGKSITVRSINPDDPNIIAATIIDCNGTADTPHRAFVMQEGIDAGTLTLSGITIRNGYVRAGVDGGAIWCSSHHNLLGLKIYNCIIEKNNARNGGAIFFWGKELEVIGCTISENTASGDGGGIYCFSESRIIVTNSSLTNNTAVEGGGISYVKSAGIIIPGPIGPNGPSFPDDPQEPVAEPPKAALIIDGCKIAENKTTGYGAAISFQYAGITIIPGPPPPPSNVPVGLFNCSIIGNKGKNIFYAKNCILAADRCVFKRNVGTGYSGTKEAGYVIRLDEISNGRLSNSFVVENTSMNHTPYVVVKPPGPLSAIGYYYSNVSTRNSTFAQNSSEEFHIYCERELPLLSTTTPATRTSFYNCIVWSFKSFGQIYWRSQYDPANPFTRSSGTTKPENVAYCNIDGDCNDVYGPCEAMGNIHSYPGFVRVGYMDSNSTPFDPNDDFWKVEGDYHLKPDSPCINAGDPDYFLYGYDPNEKDNDGQARVLNGRIDMGADESGFNTIPISDAGEDTQVYAGIDGIAKLKLDGSGSSDADGDALSYKWTWEIGGTVYKANDVSPAIELPSGVHVIQLIVNDGQADSAPDSINVTVIAPLRGTLRITPNTINRKSEQRLIEALIGLPSGIKASDIDDSEAIMLYPGQIKGIKRTTKAGGAEICTSFEKDALMIAALANGDVELKVAGKLKSGQYFYGCDVVRIIEQSTK